MARRKRTTLREDVLELHALARALERTNPTRSAATMQAHRRHVIRLANRLEERTRPIEAPQLRMPGQGSVAYLLLSLLHADVVGHNHTGLRELVGLTDAELAVRVSGAGPNTVRPRRVELVAGGWLQPAPRGKVNGQTAWTFTDAGLEAWRRG